MKKSSRSILPVEHKEIDTLKSVYNSIRNDLEGSTNNQEILNAVYKILEKYRQCEEATQDKRDEKLVNFIMDEFEKSLQPYIDNYSKTVELDDIIEDALDEYKIPKSVIDKIKQTVKVSIKKLQVKQQIINSETIVKPQIDEKQIQKQIDKNLEDIFDDITKSSNTNLKKYKEVVDEVNQKHTNDIISSYRESCKKFHEKLAIEKKQQERIETNFKINQSSEDRSNEEKSNIIPNEQTKKENKNLIKKNIGKNIIDVIKEKRKNKAKKVQITNNNPITNNKSILVKKDIQFINVFFKSFRKQLFNFLSTKFNLGKKSIGLRVFESIRNIMLGDSKKIKSQFDEYGNRIGKQEKGFKKVLRSIGVIKLIKGVLNNFLAIGKLVSKAVKNTFINFIKTPIGAYTLGYILGFIYGKIKKILESDDKLSVWDKIKKMVLKPFDAFTELLDNLYKVYIEPFYKPFEPFILKGYNTIKGTLEWLMGDGQPLVQIILSVTPLIETIFSAFFNMRKYLAMAGGPLGALIAGGLIMAYLGIKKLFKDRKDMDFRLAKASQNTLDKIGKPSSLVVKGLDEDEQKNYGELSDKISNEQVTIDGLLSDFESLKEAYKEDNSKINLYKQVPNLVETVFNSELFGYDRSAFKDFTKQADNKTIDQQIQELSNYITKNRINKLLIIKNGLASVKTSKELRNMISRIANFKDGKIIISDNVNETASNVNNLLLESDSVSGEHLALLAAHLAGNAKYKFTKTQQSTLRNAPSITTEITQEEYQQILKSPIYPGSYVHTSVQKEIIPIQQPNNDDQTKQQANQLMRGFRGNNTYRQIAKQYLLAHENLFSELSALTPEERAKKLLKIAKERANDNEKTEEQKWEKEKQEINQEIDRLNDDTEEINQYNLSTQIEIDRLKQEGVQVFYYG